MASSSAISSMFWQKSAIQAVPSACSSVPAGGQRRAAVEHADVVQARGSRPGRRCCPDGSLRFTHQVKFSSSLWKHSSRNAQVAPAPRSRLQVLQEQRPPTRAPAGSRRRSSTRRPGICPFGCRYRSRSIRSSWLLAKSGSTMRQRDAVERQVPGGVPGVLPLVRHRDDVALYMWRQSRCGRPAAAAAAAAGRGALVAASGPRRSSRTACDHSIPASACRMHRRASSAIARRDAGRRRIRPPRPAARRSRRRTLGERRVSGSGSLAGVSRSQHRRPAAGRDRQPVVRGAPWYPSPSGLTASARRARRGRRCRP